MARQRIALGATVVVVGGPDWPENAPKTRGTVEVLYPADRSRLRRAFVRFEDGTTGTYATRGLFVLREG